DAWRALVWIIRAADLYFTDSKGPGSRPKWRIVDGRPETHPVREWRAGAMARELRTWAEAVRTVHPDLGLPELPASIAADEDVKLIGLWAKTALATVTPVRPPANATLRTPAGGPFSPADLATMYGVPAEPLRKRLRTFQAQNPGCAVENPDRKPREAKWLYRLDDVLPVVEALRLSSTCPAKKKLQ
ncbi:MAG: hypothetical protein ABFE01_07435, partial [Phycisphaerales bacterium]